MKKFQDYEYISPGIRMRYQWMGIGHGYKRATWWENFEPWSDGSVLYLDVSTLVIILCFCFARYYWGKLSKMDTESYFLQLCVNLLFSQSNKFIEKLLLVEPQLGLIKSNSESGIWSHQWLQLHHKKIYIFNQRYASVVLITEFWHAPPSPKAI